MLEVMIGLLVFSIIGMTVYQLQSSSRHQMLFTANSFAAINLSAKAMADLAEEARINPTFLEMLQDYPDMLSKDPVTDGQSFYFRVGRDRQAPWGVFDVADGGGVASNDGILFQQLAPFQLQVEAHRKASRGGTDPDRHVCEVTIESSWKEKDGQPRLYKLPLEFCSPVGPVPVEGLDIDEISLQNMIRDFLFPALASRTFDQAVTDMGCDRDLAYHVGKIGVFTDTLLAALASATQDVAVLTARTRPLLSHPDARLVSLEFKIAGLQEGGASLMYNVLADLVPSFQVLAARGDAARLQRIPHTPYVTALKRFGTLSGQIFTWVGNAGASYEWLLNDGFSLAMSERKRDFARSKCLEFYRLMRVFQPTRLPTIKAFLARERARVAGRNPYAEKFLLREERLMGSETMLRKAYSNLNAIAETLSRNVMPLASSVPQLLLLYPPAKKK